jgi:hypothetical protein
MASGGHRMAPNSHIIGRVEKSGIGTRSVAEDSLQESGITAVVKCT